jgi:hypothetical protein
MPQSQSPVPFPSHVRGTPLTHVKCQPNIKAGLPRKPLRGPVYTPLSVSRYMVRTDRWNAVAWNLCFGDWIDG